MCLSPLLVGVFPLSSMQVWSSWYSYTLHNLHNWAVSHGLVHVHCIIRLRQFSGALWFFPSHIVCLFMLVSIRWFMLALQCACLGVQLNVLSFTHWQKQSVVWGKRPVIDKSAKCSRFLPFHIYFYFFNQKYNLHSPRTRLVR